MNVTRTTRRFAFRRESLTAAVIIALLLTVLPLPASAATSSAQTAKVVGTVSLRAKPAVTGTLIRYLQKGETAQVLDKPNAYWLHVKDSKGHVGYVSSSASYISLQQAAPTPAPTSTPTPAPTSKPTATPTPMPSATPTPTPKPTATPSPTPTPTSKPTATPTPTPTPTPMPSATPTPAPTPAPTSTPTPAPSPSPTPTPTSMPQPTIAPTPNGQIVATVSFRKGPSTDAERIRYMQKGELVTVLDKVNAYWYRVADASYTIGYVSTSESYIDTMFGAPNGDPDEAFSGNATVVSSVSFRKGPSTGAERIRYLAKGEEMLILSKTNDSWYMAQDKNGVIGYVSTGSQYISTTFAEPRPTIPAAEAAEKAIAAGMKYIGTPYEYGSSRSDTTTFDCSDFVRQAFLDALQLKLPGDSRSQAAFVRSIGHTTTDWHALKRGDLMFFMSYKGYRASDYAGIDKTNERVTHVGIYLGNGQILHTYSVPSGGVRIDSIEGKPWELRFLFGGSAL